MAAKLLLQTELCSRLGTTLPIVGAPMGGVAGPELVAAVSNAGGLGVLGAANTDPGVMRDEIRQTKALTQAPFGVGLLFPHSSAATSATTTAPGSAGLPEFLAPLAKWPLAPAQETRSFDLDETMTRFEIVLAEGVSVLTCGLGTPPEIVDRAHAAGIVVISLVGSRRAALEVEAAGTDVIVAQGHEAGGHTGRVTTLVLIPQVVDAVNIPVLAAGGIVDGRGLAAALMLGASGALIGTRLLATPEARTSSAHKDAVAAMVDDDTVVSRSYTGKPSRVLRNSFTDAWRDRQDEILPMPQQWESVQSLVRPAKLAGSLEVANWPTGQAAVLISEVSPAGVVVQRMAAEAAAIIRDSAAAQVVAI